VTQISLFGSDSAQEGLCHGEMRSALSGPFEKRPGPRFLSARHFAPARHLASCLGWKPAHTYADRRWLSLVVIVALLRSSRRTDYHPVVGEEIARWAMARRLPAHDIVFPR
jgi:hypothetical protein